MNEIIIMEFDLRENTFRKKFISTKSTLSENMGIIWRNVNKCFTK